MKKYWVYILSNKYQNVFYVGFTSDILKRTRAHRNGYGSHFTKKYNVKRLLYFEEHSNYDKARKRELLIKRYRRQWKVNLISSINPDFNDLFTNITLDK